MAFGYYGGWPAYVPVAERRSRQACSTGRASIERGDRGARLSTCRRCRSHRSRGEQAVGLPADALHDRFGQAPLQQLDQRVDAAGAVGADRPPGRGGQRLDGDQDRIDLRADHFRPDLARADPQIDHRAVADIAASARQAIGEILVALEIFAPGLAPETRRDLAPFDDDRRRRLSGFPHPRDFEQSLAPAAEGAAIPIAWRHMGRHDDGAGARAFPPVAGPPRRIFQPQQRSVVRLRAASF
jgi:hypothetical protein